ncbi:MAG TPA: RidA family protein [Usitatibacter sp.]|jgi:enamine deaminase RidA (YjgF/YER057c/UK114 family)|nr:RidA family protein [Usitatibacter sp.]
MAKTAEEVKKVTEQKVRYIDPPGACPAQGLYSHAARVSAGDLYFIAGQLAVDDGGEIVGKHDFEAQFHKVFTNMGVVLNGLGISFDEVAKFTTYFVHSQDIEKFMKLRAELFPKIFKGSKFPPNTICVIDRLVKEDFLLEVEAVARVA